MTPERQVWPRAQRDDSGVALVLALVFILVVGLFSTVALTKASTTTVQGVGLRDRGQLQYSLDGAVERGLQTLTSDMNDADPSLCAQPSAPTATGTLALNARTTTWSCTLLAGRAKRSTDITTTDYALVVTSPHPGALTTQSGTSSDVVLGGSVYLNGSVADGDLKKAIHVVEGDIVAPSSRAGCETSLAALTEMTVEAGFLKTCTEQTLAQALPTVSLPTAPSYVIPSTLRGGVNVPMGGGKTCRVFYPGQYTSAPTLASAANYFVSGVYWFNGIGSWGISGNGLQVTGGRRSLATDSAALSGDCAAMTDSTALDQPDVAALLAFLTPSTLSYGNTWVLSGSSALALGKAEISLYSPPAGSSAHPMSVVAFGTTTNGYTPLAGTGTTSVISGMSNNTNARINGKVYAPTGIVDAFSTNMTEAVLRGGLVAYEATLQASTSGGDGLVVTASRGSGTPPPPFRTVRVVATDTSGGTPARNTAVATISNFAPYTVKTKSWRTS